MALAIGAHPLPERIALSPQTLNLPLMPAPGQSDARTVREINSVDNWQVARRRVSRRVIGHFIKQPLYDQVGDALALGFGAEEGGITDGGGKRGGHEVPSPS